MRGLGGKKEAGDKEGSVKSMVRSVRRSRKGERGNAMIEFALCMSFLTPLLLGTFNVGMNLGRNLQVTQLARNTGHMYVRWVDFSQPASQDLIVRLAQGLNLQRTGGDGLVILSQVTVPTEDDCAASSLSAGECVNQDQAVVIHRVAFGNTSLLTSRFGNPPNAAVDASGSIPPDKYLTDPAVRVPNWTNQLTLKDGEIAYVAEVYVRSPQWSLNGAGGSEGVYARSIF
jgi:Flp pilus assembly pilin Flp